MEHNRKISTGLQMYMKEESLLDIITMFCRKVMDILGDFKSPCPLCGILLIALTLRLSIDILRLLRSYIPQNKVHQLGDAIAKNDTQLALMLLESSLVNVVIRKADGYTPFLLACMNGNTILVRAMLALGADIYSMTTQQENAFYLAAFNCVCNITSKDASCIHALYHAGVDINARNHNGYSPVQMAAMFGHAGLVQWLVEKGADVDTRPTPYDIAVRYGFPEVADRLCLISRRHLLCST